MTEFSQQKETKLGKCFMDCRKIIFFLCFNIVKTFSYSFIEFNRKKNFFIVEKSREKLFGNQKTWLFPKRRKTEKFLLINFGHVQRNH